VMELESYQRVEGQTEALPVYTRAQPRSKLAVVAVVVVLVTVAVVLCVALGVFKSDNGVTQAMGDDAYTMDRYYVSDSSAVCNDGSASTYYTREAQGSSRNVWVVYVEGGTDFCFDESSCDTRMETLDYGSSTGRPSTRDDLIGGVLSLDSTINPNYYDASFAAVQYCSSDWWSGNADADALAGKSEYVFMGSRILRGAIADLLSTTNIGDASEVLIAGYGAGCMGGFLYIDEIQSQIADTGSKATVRALLDSCWFIYQEEHYKDSLDCASASSCFLDESLTAAQSLWLPDLPARCTDAGLEWECYIGEYSSPKITSPIFVFEWLYEQSQLSVDGAPVMPKSDEEIAFAETTADNKIDSYDAIPNNGAVFSPACLNHELIYKDTWNDYHVNGQDLSEAIGDWIAGTSVSDVDSCGAIGCNEDC